MVLSTEWSQVEVIDLRNDGSGLGFGIVGGRSTGVVIKSILPGGIADKDNRLQSGDHIIQIGEVNLRGFSAEQVASVLRSAGCEVRMVVARPIESTSEQFKHRADPCNKFEEEEEEDCFENRITSIVPTKILTDPEEIERLLISNGYQDYDNNPVENEIAEESFIVNGSCDSLEDNTASNFDSNTCTAQFNPSATQLNSSAIAENLSSSNSAQFNTNHVDNVVEKPLVANDAGNVKTPLKLVCASSCNNLKTHRLSTFSDTTELTANAKQFDGAKKRHSDFNRDSETTGSSFRNTTSTPNFNPPCYTEPPPEYRSHIDASAFNPDAITCCYHTPQRPYDKQTSPPSSGNATATFEVDIDIEYSALPETERFTVPLNRTEYGLGITIAGYVCEREDLSGIFVKGVSEGSEAHKCGRINVNDRIVEVNGDSLHDCTNYEAVEKLKKSGSEVALTFERYLRGPKYEHLQEALAVTKEVQKDLSPPSPSLTTLSWIPIDTEPQIEPEGESCTTINSEIYYETPETKEIFVEDNFRSEPSPDCEGVIKRKWSTIIGEEAEIVVAHLTKLTGLGISLEGTVDVEAGIEVRPHHYIRSILPEGPVGQNGRLNSGDELLEVNGQKLLGIKHVEVVKILKDLPSTVRLVCARKNEENRVINTSQDREAFEARNIVGGSLKNLLNNTQQQQEKEKRLLKAFSDTLASEKKETCAEVQTHHQFNQQRRLLKALSDTLDSQSEHQQNQQRLLKALSDTSINTSSTATITDENSLSHLNKAKSRSLENTNLAMWGDDVEYIDLMKTDRGLGFSILDYQDPVDVKSTVIVIRSLVPNGAAEIDGRLRPGDRLISVNDKSVKNSTLDQAVQVLKGAQMGVVKLGVARPLPVVRGGSGGSSSSPTIGS